VIQNAQFLRLQEREIPWEQIRFLELHARSIGLILQDHSRLRFEYPSEDELDFALRQAFADGQSDVRS
jgi:hypothetical protein